MQSQGRPERCALPARRQSGGPRRCVARRRPAFSQRWHQGHDQSGWHRGHDQSGWRSATPRPGRGPPVCAPIAALARTADLPLWSGSVRADRRSDRTLSVVRGLTAGPVRRPEARGKSITPFSRRPDRETAFGGLRSEAWCGRKFGLRQPARSESDRQSLPRPVSTVLRRAPVLPDPSLPAQPPPARHVARESCDLQGAGRRRLHPR